MPFTAKYKAELINRLKDGESPKDIADEEDVSLTEIRLLVETDPEYIAHLKKQLKAKEQYPELYSATFKLLKNHAKDKMVNKSHHDVDEHTLDLLVEWKTCRNRVYEYMDILRHGYLFDGKEEKAMLSVQQALIDIVMKKKKA
jgi:hypothetical protein